MAIPTADASSHAAPTAAHDERAAHEPTEGHDSEQRDQRGHQREVPPARRREVPPPGEGILDQDLDQRSDTDGYGRERHQVPDTRRRNGREECGDPEKPEDERCLDDPEDEMPRQGRPQTRRLPGVGVPRSFVCHARALLLIPITRSSQRWLARCPPSKEDLASSFEPITLPIGTPYRTIDPPISVAEANRSTASCASS
ncbi:hypothetical protein ACR8AL_05550 [Clavibacter sepedonicus]|uniref:hypothetical protein n=1 Tax=Clavibacter TaxID=1573 RepID=UPI001CC23551|nr:MULTISPECIES: hypothetical protein [Clavibacter]UUK65372.1 hypothetical protein LRE50_14025 [Clavibacter sepedonicus]